MDWSQLDPDSRVSSLDLHIPELTDCHSKILVKGKK
jgi:hypothetical protein